MSEAVKLIDAQLADYREKLAKATAAAATHQSNADARRQEADIYHECIDELERDKATIEKSRSPVVE